MGENQIGSIIRATHNTTTVVLCIRACDVYIIFYFWEYVYLTRGLWILLIPLIILWISALTDIILNIVLIIACVKKSVRLLDWYRYYSRYLYVVLICLYMLCCLYPVVRDIWPKCFDDTGMKRVKCIWTRIYETAIWFAMVAAHIYAHRLLKNEIIRLKNESEHSSDNNTTDVEFHQIHSNGEQVCDCVLMVYLCGTIPHFRVAKTGIVLLDDTIMIVLFVAAIVDILMNGLLIHGCVLRNQPSCIVYLKYVKFVSMSLLCIYLLFSLYPTVQVMFPHCLDYHDTMGRLKCVAITLGDTIVCFVLVTVHLYVTKLLRNHVMGTTPMFCQFPIRTTQCQCRHIITDGDPI